MSSHLGFCVFIRGSSWLAFDAACVPWMIPPVIVLSMDTSSRGS